MIRLPESVNCAVVFDETVGELVDQMRWLVLFRTARLPSEVRLRLPEVSVRGDSLLATQIWVVFEFRYQIPT